MVLDTRKTTPGLRALEKYAVRCGAAPTKRMGLYDVAMIKDNHKLAAGEWRYLRRRARGIPGVDVQVEVTTSAEALEAIDAGARFIMCDNMSVELLRATVDAIRATGRASRSRRPADSPWRWRPRMPRPASTTSRSVG